MTKNQIDPNTKRRNCTTYEFSPERPAKSIPKNTPTRIRIRVDTLKKIERSPVATESRTRSYCWPALSKKSRRLLNGGGKTIRERAAKISARPQAAEGSAG